MAQIQIPYEEASERVAQELRKYPCLYLATSDRGYPTVRRMAFVS